ncbi:MAG: hypothetical protein ACI9OJ_002400 [Myxococcota bacterium]|jgi:hypothetical protein
MQYMLLIYSEASDSEPSPKERGEVMAAYQAFNEHVKAKGAFVGGDALQPIATATTVRVRDGKTLHTDGPFAETKELLGGYYLVDVQNLDEALDLAARIPGARYGSIEVRPLMDLSRYTDG